MMYGLYIMYIYIHRGHPHTNQHMQQPPDHPWAPKIPCSNANIDIYIYTYNYTVSMFIYIYMILDMCIVKLTRQMYVHILICIQ